MIKLEIYENLIFFFFLRNKLVAKYQRSSEKMLTTWNIRIHLVYWMEITIEIKIYIICNVVM